MISWPHFLALAGALSLTAVLPAQTNPRYWGTALGGSDWDVASAVTAAPNGEVIVAGHTRSPDFPTTAGAFQTAPAGVEDAFVARLSPDGSQLLAATRLGGTHGDTVSFVHRAQDGSIWVGGTTWSSNFPTTSDAFATHAGRRDAFLANFDSSLGTLLYSTTFGTQASELGSAFAIDEANQLLYMAGFGTPPTTPDALRRRGAGNDAYFAILDRSTPNQTTLRYSTLIGGTGLERSLDGLSVDANGVVTVTGTTQSTDFPVTATAFQSSRGGTQAGFVLRVDPSVAGAAGLVYGSYFGGSGIEYTLRHVVGANGQLHLLLISSSADLPTTPNALLATAGGSLDAFFAQLDPSQSGAAGLVYGSYIASGRSSEGQIVGDFGSNVGADLTPTSGGVAIFVETSSPSVGPGGPAGGFQMSGSGFRGYVTVLDLTGGPAPTVAYSSHYNGCNQYMAKAIATHPSGDLLLVGHADMPPSTPGCFQIDAAGRFDGSIGRLQPTPWPSSFRNLGASCPTSVGVPALTGVSRPRICRTMRVSISGLPPSRPGLIFFGSTTSWLGSPLPFAIPGAPGCFLFAAPDISVSLPTGSGTRTFDVPVAGSPLLHGLELGVQYAVLDPGANVLGIATTNGLAVAVRW